MSKFEVILFFHIVGVVLIAGGAGVGMAAGIAMPRTTSVRAISSLSALGARTEHFVTTPGAVLTLVTGTWFLVEFDDAFDIGETWLWLSYVVWVVAVLIGEAVLGRFHHRMHDRAEELLARGEETSEDLRVAAGAPLAAAAGMVNTALLVLFIYLMIAKPGRG